MFTRNGFAPNPSTSDPDPNGATPLRPAQEDVLDRMAEIVRRGRTDRNAVRRIVHEYGIPNDAGIIDTIVDRTVESVSNAVHRYDITRP
jgi:hypothetical protein